jgi:hypothetical protein
MAKAIDKLLLKQPAKAWLTIKGISEEARHIAKKKIRAQLLESVERTQQAALADAQKAKSWEERERLRPDEILCERAPISLLRLRPSIDPTMRFIDTRCTALAFDDVCNRSGGAFPNPQQSLTRSAGGYAVDACYGAGVRRRCRPPAPPRRLPV